MDRTGGEWSENGTTDHKLTTEMDGDDISHRYYCHTNRGGVCSCDGHNNNDYTKLKKNAKSRRNSNFNQNYFHEDPPYDPCTASGGSLYMTRESPQPKSGYAPFYTSSSHLHETTPCADSPPCDRDPNSSYCDYFDPSKTYGCPSYEVEGSFTPPKIQVTAKILFGTVSAITDLKQKKAAKKN